MEHTKGPWRIVGHPGYEALEIVTDQRRIARTLYHSGSEDNEVDANARLIAAAPGLLEALADIRRVIASRGRTNKDIYVSIPGEYVLMIDNMAARGITEATGE